MPTLNYRGCYIHHTPDFFHEICKVYSDKELTNEIYDFVLLDVHGGCPYPITDIHKAIMDKIDKWLEKTTDRIEIEVGMWETAPCPIYTKNVDVDKVEKLLYASAVQSYGKEVVEDYITNPAYKEDGWTTEWEHFQEWLCAEEEAIIMECGGIYYEDMTDEEYEKIMQES